MSPKLQEKEFGTPFLVLIPDSQINLGVKELSSSAGLSQDHRITTWFGICSFHSPVMGRDIFHCPSLPQAWSSSEERRESCIPREQNLPKEPQPFVGAKEPSPARVKDTRDGFLCQGGGDHTQLCSPSVSNDQHRSLKVPQESLQGCKVVLMIQRDLKMIIYFF